MNHKLLQITLLLSFFAFQAKAQDGINSSTFNNIQGVWYGPGTLSGRITAIEGVYNDPKKIVVGTAGGGVWITDNGGATFKNKFEKYCQSIGAIAIDQKNPKTIFVGTGESNMRNTVSYGEGMYVSQDGGGNWKKIGLDSTEHISKILIDPNNSKVVYVAAPGALWSNSAHRGLYKSEDGGQTWNKILFVNDSTGCADIVMNPNNPNELLATTWQFRRTPFSFNSGGKGSGMFKSMDGGKTWTKITKGLPEGDLGRIALALSPSKPNHILAIVESKVTGLYESNDGGLSWAKQSATLNVEARPFYFSTIAFDPKDDNRVYRPAYEFSISNDAGKSFTEASNEGVWLHSDHHALWINPNYTNQLWVGTDGGVYLSNDRGASWLFLPNLPVGQLYHATYDFKTPYNVYVGLQDNGSHMAPSQDFGGVNNGSWRALFGGDGFWVQADPDGKTAYAEYQGGNAYRIDLATGKGNPIQPTETDKEEKLRYNWNTPLILGAKNPKNLYMAAQYLYKSTNQGKDWRRISPDLTTNDPLKLKQEQSGGLSADNTSAENHCTIYTLTESPLDENMIAVGTDDGNLQITTDAGLTWKNVSANYAQTGIPAQTWITSIELSKFDKNVIYATFDNHFYGDFNTYVAKSTDLGKTWTKLSTPDLKGFASKIKEDTKNKNLLFLGTERGLWISTNAGKTWFKFKNNMNEMAMVRDIQIHPKEHDVLVATHGNGLIVLRDIEPMRAMDSSTASKTIHVFEIADSDISYGNFISGFPLNLGWEAPNKDESVAFTYYLKKRMISGDVEIIVKDMKDSVIRKMEGSNKKGINEVNWDMRITPPKVAKGGSKPDYGGFIAPKVLPGMYKIVFKIGDSTFERKMNVKLNPKSTMTLEDCNKQFAVAKQCMNMHERLAILVDSVTAVEMNLKAKGVQKDIDSIASFKNTLLATKNSSIFADEKRLREEITELYSKICSQESSPGNLQMENLKKLEKELEKAQTAWMKIRKDNNW